MPDLYASGSGLITLPTSQVATIVLGTSSAPRITINYLAISFDGTSATATPVNCVIARIASAPTSGGSPPKYGPNPLRPSAPTSTVTVYGPSGGAAWGGTAPSAGAIVWEMDIPPTTGLPQWWPLGQEIEVSGSAWIGVFLNAPAAVTARTFLYHSE